MLKGAIVKVIRSGKTFNRYRELVESEFPQMLDSWRNGFCPANGECGLLIGTCNHPDDGRKVCGVLLESGAFILIGAEGIQEVVNADRSNS